MNFSRRELTTLFSLVAAKAAAQTQGSEVLPSKVYHPSQLPYRGDDKKKGRRFFYGVNHTGFRLEVHETVLGPGVQTHTPHRHEHDEFLVVLEGTVNAVIEGKAESAEAGSIIYFGSNQLHTLVNAGKSPCRYCAIELRGSAA
jgi:XRE family transcriptional regulator, regulator of sulfur utilization